MEEGLMLEKFIEEINKNKLKVDSIILSKGQEYYEHFFRENRKRDGRSLSKVVSGLTLGIAMEKNILQLEDPIMDYFTEIKITNERNIEHLKNTKIKHLLSMSMGHDMPLMMRRDYKQLAEDTDYISYILNSDINYPPGTHFVYTNAVTYLLSAIMQKLTGQTLDEWAYENLLSQIDIEEPYWEHSHQGICMGSTGLHLDAEDVHKIGKLLLNKGLYKGNKVVGSAWIDEMKKMQVMNQDFEKFHNPDNTCIKKLAYGYHLWVGEDYFFGDGADGQQLIICPKEEMIVAIMARVSNGNLLEKIICDNLLAFLKDK